MIPRTDPAPSWLLIGPALAASLGAFLLAVAIGPVATAIRLDMDLPAFGIVWLSVAFLLPAGLAVPLGFLAGPRWPTAVTLPAIVLLVIGSLLTSLGPGSVTVLLGRAVSGFGAGLAWGVTAFLIVRGRSGPPWVAPAVGGAVGLALVFGVAAAAFIARAIGWRWPFLLAVPFGAVALVAAAVCGTILLSRTSRRVG
jgi:MFS family permease